MGRVRGTIEYRELPQAGDLKLGAEVDPVKDVRIVRVFGTLFFANATALKDALISGKITYDSQHRKYVAVDLSSS